MVAVVGALAGTFASEMVGLQNTVRALLIALLVLYSARGIRALARSR